MGLLYKVIVILFFESHFDFRLLYLTEKRWDLRELINA